MEAALTHAATIAGGSDNAAAVHTAVHMVLNTAIKLHQSELDKANAPLIELIDARITTRIKSALDDIHYAIETNMRTVDEKIESAIDDIDVEGQIENAIDNIDLETRVQEYMENNPVDVQDLLGGACVSITFG
jgi:hypothetical protein